MAWAFATLQFSDLTAMDVISVEALKKLQEFAVQHLANSFWTFAKLAVMNSKLVDAIAAEALQRLGNFEPQALTNTV